MAEKYIGSIYHGRDGTSAAFLPTSTLHRSTSTLALPPSTQECILFAYALCRCVFITSATSAPRRMIRPTFRPVRSPIELLTSLASRPLRLASETNYRLLSMLRAAGHTSSYWSALGYTCCKWSSMCMRGSEGYRVCYARQARGLL